MIGKIIIGFPTREIYANSEAAFCRRSLSAIGLDTYRAQVKTTAV